MFNAFTQQLRVQNVRNAASAMSHEEQRSVLTRVLEMISPEAGAKGVPSDTLPSVNESIAGLLANDELRALLSEQQQARLERLLPPAESTPDG